MIDGASTGREENSDRTLRQSGKSLKCLMLNEAEVTMAGCRKGRRRDKARRWGSSMGRRTDRHLAWSHTNGSYVSLHRNRQINQNHSHHSRHSV